MHILNQVLKVALLHTAHALRKTLTIDRLQHHLLAIEITPSHHQLIQGVLLPR